jgi:hypothetical protein
MSSLTVRVLLLIACLSAIGAAVFHLWTSDRRARLDAESTRQFDLLSRTAARSVADLRAAQQAYVAPGQGEAFWFERANAIVAELEQQLAQLPPFTTSPDARAALDEAGIALRDFVEMDRRVREYASQGQLTRASDMIFADGFDLTKRAADAVTRAASSEHVYRDAGAAEIQKTQVQTLLGAAAVTLLALVLLVPRATGRTAERTAVTSVVPQVQTARAAPAPRPVQVPRPQQPRPVQVAAASHAPVLGKVAALCSDLARIGDTHALPALLERSASVLDASGIVLWIADPDGRELAPILVHGYPPRLAAQMGTMARDAGNLTASAYRTGLLQTVKGDAISSGAIAVPLVAAAGCVGVMSAEVKNGGEQQEDLLAAATIVAAQLATLVGPPSARGRTEAVS